MTDVVKGGSYEGKELISWPFCCCHKFQRNVTRRELASLAQWVRFCGMGVQKLTQINLELLFVSKKKFSSGFYKGKNLFRGRFDVVISFSKG